jgi:GntR family transcriptional regulator
MIIHIDPESENPIYTQLTNQIIEGIARGDIQPGTTLPSVRAFAADLGVNMHTVNKSYHQLEKKGIIRIVPKSGAIIQEQQNRKGNHETKERLLEEFKPLIAEALVFGLRRQQIQELFESIVVDLEGKTNQKP